jgi:hypothetical protein
MTANGISLYESEIEGDVDEQFGNIMSAKDFIESCNSGLFVDDDGYAHPIIHGSVDITIFIRPSDIDQLNPAYVTIAWYNK